MPNLPSRLGALERTHRARLLPDRMLSVLLGFPAARLSKRINVAAMFDVHTDGVYTDSRAFAFEEIPMTTRINVVLPVETIKVLDRVAPKGSRSRLISEAVLHYVECKAKSNLAERLKAGALANARRDLEIAQEWFSVDEEAWQRTKPGRRRAR